MITSAPRFRSICITSSGVNFRLEPSMWLRNSTPSSATHPAVGLNFDPSHLFWQGVDIPAAIRVLAECIFHVHAKDLAFDRQNVAVNGVLVAVGEVVIIDDSTAVRVTEILPPPSSESGS